MKAFVCCLLRRDLRAVQESSLARARLHSHVHSSCVRTGVIAPRIPSPATSRGLSDTLGNFQQAADANGRPVVETRFAFGSAIFSSSMSDQALSAAAKEVVNSLLGLGVAAATLSIIARTWLLEVVGAIGSNVAACRGGIVQPHTTTIIILLMPRAFSFQTALPKTVRSERPVNGTPLYQ